MPPLASRQAPRDPGPGPWTFAEWRDHEAGGTFVVCGCGESLNLLEQPERFITIGVNDVGRLFQPDYLVVLNPRQQFTGDRFRYVETSRARAVFTQLHLGIAHPRLVRFRQGVYGGTNLADPNTLPVTQNSPYVAVCLAVHLGARRIGLIGVDFTDRHFFGATGAHPLSRRLTAIDSEYQRLHAALAARGVELVNLSPVSRLTSIPRISLRDFGADEHQRLTTFARRLRIVSYATTPVAGVPAILARCINAATSHEARCVWASRAYGNGVRFDGDLEWRERGAEARAALADADVVIVHNGKVDPQHRALIAGKPVVTMAHNYAWNVDQHYVQQGLPGVVVGQYQATLPEFAGWRAVPNPIPLWEAAYQPEPKSDVVTIAYTPSGRHDSYPAGHRLYWHGKGYTATMHVLDILARRYPIRILSVRSGQISHDEALAMKRRAHIVIDECVTGSYHRNSLEGLACGCVVINGVGRLPGMEEVLLHCALDAADAPFLTTGLDGLEAVLRSLIEQGAAALEASGQRNRAWFERQWDFRQQWDRYWQPCIDEAVARMPKRAPPTPSLAHQAAGTEPKAGVSVVVPHGGAERKPLLHACLESLRAGDGVAEVIVAEMDDAPLARNVAAEFADGYLFIGGQGSFHKARVINTALPLAGCDLVLWLDNDLILPEGFLPAAVTELRERGLDCLIPWTSIRYLSREDSIRVQRDQVAPASCRPAQTFWSRRGACGGAVLVRRDFLERSGGLCEAFRGWGGEDNAWFHTAGVFGRAAITRRTDHHLYHLYHARSGGYGTELPHERNVQYAANVALLQEIRTLRTPQRFLARFPLPANPPCPWPASRRIATKHGGGTLADRLLAMVASALRNAYGVTLCSDESLPADVVLSCEPDAGTDGSPKLVISRRCAGAEIAREAVLLDEAMLSERRQTLLMKLIGPLSVLLADAQATAVPTVDTIGQAVCDLQERPRMKLNLGCCDAILDGYVNVDMVEVPGVQQLADLRATWPWPDSSVDFIRAHDIIEHLPDKIFTMNEMWRVLKEGGQAEIVVPTTDGPGAFQDPTHVSFWHRRSFLYYEAGNPYRERFARAYGIAARFRVARERIDMTQDGPKLTIALTAVKP
jgi:SAM-dependent methyltransferase